jgi:mercuric ion binding protein
MRNVAAILSFLLASAIAQAADRTTVFAIENMTCATCPLTVKTAIGRLDGVKKVDVDFDKKTATVLFDDDKVSEAAMSDASRNAGFPAKAVH